MTMRRTDKSGGIFFLETLRTKEVDVFGERGITEYFLSELGSGLYLEKEASVTDSQKS